MTSTFLATESTIILLLLIACLGAIYFQRFKLPYTVGLVIVGLLLGFAEEAGLPLKQIILSPDLILFLFVPPLVFASASNINHRLFFHNIFPAFTLAGPGLIISTAIIGGILTFLTPLDLGGAMLFGALISATDPVAVVALFEELGVPKRLNMMVDGESMLNDATAIVAFDVVLSVIQSGVFNGTTILQALIRVVIVLVGGVVVGLLVGSGMGFAIRLAKDNIYVQATVSLLVAYIAFIIAQNYLGVSGVIAVLTAGLMVGRYKAYNIPINVNHYLDDFWGYVGFLANSLIFLLVGLTSSTFILNLPLTQLSFWGVIITTIIVTYLARGIMVFGLTSLINPLLKDGPISWQYALVSFWGGLRGAVALALALSLATDFPNRDLLIAMTLGVALFTILVGGLTTGGLLHRLGLDQPPLVDQLSEQQALLTSKKLVVEQLTNLESTSILSQELVNKILPKYQSQVEEAQVSLDSFNTRLQEKSSSLKAQLIWWEIINLEMSIELNFYESGFLSARTLNRLKFFNNLKIAKIEEKKLPPPHYFFHSSPTGKEDILLNFVRRFASQSRWVQQQIEEKLKSDYELMVILKRTSQVIIERIERASQEGAFPSDVAQDSLNYYQYIQERATSQLQELAQTNPALAQAIEQRLLKQFALVKVKEHIQEIVKQGKINSEISEKVLQNISQSLIRLETK